MIADRIDLNVANTYQEKYQKREHRNLDRKQNQGPDGSLLACNREETQRGSADFFWRS
jgi:hypothetical protein